MPETFGDTRDHILSLKAKAGNPIAYIEQVGGFMGGGGKNVAAAHTMFQFGEGYGFLQGILMAYDIPLITVRPQLWQSSLHLGNKDKNASKTEWKNYLKGKAQEYFPSLKITLKTADALLILRYAMQDRDRMRQLAKMEENSTLF